MAIVRRLTLLTAIRTLQGIEHLLDVLFLSKPYIPFGIASLVIGFFIGLVLIR